MNGYDALEDESLYNHTEIKVEWPPEYKCIIEFCDWIDTEMPEDEFNLMSECLKKTIQDFLTDKEYDELDECELPPPKAVASYGAKLPKA